MTVERRYLCNLCRESRDPSGGEIHGVYFTGAGSHLVLTSPTRHQGSSVENHICDKCLKELLAAATPRGEEGL